MFLDSHALSVSDTVSVHSWIIDSGAIDHMTCSSHNFSTYSPCPSNKKITIADGSSITVVGQGDIFLGPSLILKNVLHVPKLTTNLISVRQAIETLNCNLIFSKNSCVFQDQATGKTIGHATETAGLYYFKLESGKVNAGVGYPFLLLSDSFTNEDQILLHHLQLGHLSKIMGQRLE